MKKTSSSTQHSLWFKCPYAHYLYTREGGSGIVNKAEGMNTAFGTAIHEGTEQLCLGRSLDEAIEKFLPLLEGVEGETPDGHPRRTELEWLGTCLLYSSNEYLVPRLLQEFEVIASEQEYVFPLDSETYWCCRPDLTLNRRADGTYFNGNIKSSSYLNDMLTNYEFSVQMLMEAHAVKLHRGLDIGGSIIIALSKGQKGKLSKRDFMAGKTGYRLESPFTYVWWDKGTYSFQWTKNAEKMAVWEFNSNPREWYAKIPEDLKRAQVAATDPIRHSSKLRFDDVAFDIKMVEYMADQKVCPRSYESCNSFSTYRKPCDYKLWCYGTEQERADNFIPRRFNHPFEEAVMGEEI